MSEIERPYDFTEGFQRKILALAIRSDLLVRCPGVFQARFFGPPKTLSPRHRLARLIENFGKENRNQRPGNETTDELVRREALMLRPAEREAFEAEWQEVRNIEVPDPDYVMGRASEWARDVAFESALVQSAGILEATRKTGRQDFTEAKKLLDQAFLVGAAEGRGGIEYLEDHAGLWVDDITRRQVPTGLAQLDAALDGGPQFGEVMYVLAPPKGAKSSFLLNIALNASRLRKGVAFFSYEMRKEPVVQRLDRKLTQSTKQDLRENPGLVTTALAGMRAAGAGDLWVQEFYSRKQGVEEAARVIERRRGMGFEVDLVVFDYLNIMSASKREREKRHELPQISRDMAELAKELDVVVWSAALVNRKAVSKERIKKTDIAEAFEVVAVADGMVAICAPEILRKHKQRRLFLAALREEEDEKDAGIYVVDLARMIFRELRAGETPAIDTEKEEGDGELQTHDRS